MAIKNDMGDLLLRLSDLTLQLGITNEKVGTLAEQLKVHTQIIYGDTANGGILSKINRNEEQLIDHDKTIKELKEQCGKVADFMTAQVEITKFQAESIKNLGIFMRYVAITIVIILIVSGIIGWREIYQLTQSLGL